MGEEKAQPSGAWLQDVEGYKSTGYSGNKADSGWAMMGKAPCDAHLRG